MTDDGFELADVDALAGAVRDAFPDLHFARAALVEGGGDYRVLVLDGRFAFRFPRRPHHVGLKTEIAVLRALQARCAVPTPDYRYVDPLFRFAGYRFIEGSPLTRRRFPELGEAGRVQVLGELAALLKALHGLDPATVFGRTDWPRIWTATEFAARALAEGLPLIQDFDAHLAERARSFLLAYSGQTSASRAVVHGDLVAEHLLLDAVREGLAGVLDFGDVAVGDPAGDFIGLWAFGGEAVSAALGAYGAGDQSRAMLERSQRGWARYCIDRVWQALSYEEPDEAAEWATCARAVLDDLAVTMDGTRP